MDAQYECPPFFKIILGSTGTSDRSIIIYDSDKFELLDFMELRHVNIGGRVRAPLVAKFKVKSSGTEFFFMVNHLYRSKAARRLQQASMLNDWASRQQLPVIAVGDYNFDWSVIDGDTDHDEGYDNMTANSVFEWVRPAILLNTHDSDFNSVLDFVFASRDAKNWAVNSTILVEHNDFPDTNETSDHRPVHAKFNLSQSASVSKEDILEKIEKLKEDIENLKELVEQLP
ncbi:hypothetical protein N9174_03615 [bacterium]|nr:hypothetical protein [bacterium]